MASGSQMCSGNMALLPAPPTNISPSASGIIAPAATSSYLLIGFYYTKKEAVAASKKAFIVTRFADLGFLIGILIYGYYAGTFSFTPETHALVAAGAMIPLALGLM